jgi:hypothetical protein
VSKRDAPEQQPKEVAPLRDGLVDWTLKSSARQVDLSSPFLDATLPTARGCTS